MALSVPNMQDYWIHEAMLLRKSLFTLQKLFTPFELQLMWTPIWCKLSNYHILAAKYEVCLLISYIHNMEKDDKEAESGAMQPK